MQKLSIVCLCKTPFFPDNYTKTDIAWSSQENAEKFYFGEFQPRGHLWERWRWCIDEKTRRRAIEPAWTSHGSLSHVHHLVGGLEHHFPIYWEFHHPNWLSLIFFRGVAIKPPTSHGNKLRTSWGICHGHVTRGSQELGFPHRIKLPRLRRFNPWVTVHPSIPLREKEAEEPLFFPSNITWIGFQKRTYTTLSVNPSFYMFLYIFSVKSSSRKDNRPQNRSCHGQLPWPNWKSRLCGSGAQRDGPFHRNMLGFTMDFWGVHWDISGKWGISPQFTARWRKGCSQLWDWAQIQPQAWPEMVIHALLKSWYKFPLQTSKGSGYEKHPKILLWSLGGPNGGFLKWGYPQLSSA